MTVTFATPIIKAPCDHEEVMCGWDVGYINYRCIYCKRDRHESTLTAMNC